MKTVAVIVAAGSGTRFGAETPKQFLDLAGETVLARSVRCFDAVSQIAGVVLVVAEDRVPDVRSSYTGVSEKLLAVVAGGARRQDSVAAGVAVAREHSAEFVAIHDAARPFARVQDIAACIEAAHTHGNAILALPARDTIKMERESCVAETLPRESIWQAQTPQVFRITDLDAAFAHADAQEVTGTDEAALLEALGKPVALVQGHPWNFKITTQDDMVLAEAVAAAMQ